MADGKVSIYIRYSRDENHVNLLFAHRSLFDVRRSVEFDPILEEDDLINALFNVTFHLLLTLTRFGKVQVYEAKTGAAVTEFSVRPKDPITGQYLPLKRSSRGVIVPIVTHAAFDQVCV
jgi:hypothetical protein